MREADYCAFRGDVGWTAGDAADLRRIRCSEDDGSALVRDHLLGDKAREEERTRDVHSQDALPLAGLGLVPGLSGPDRCEMQQRSNLTQSRRGILGRGTALLDIPDIGGDGV